MIEKNKERSTKIAFLAILSVKILILCLIESHSQVVVGYVEFIKNFIENPSLNPWGNWVKEGGDLQAFPYGYAQLMAFVPLALVSQLLGGAGYGLLAYKLTLLLADIFIYFLLRRIYKDDKSKVLWIYWASPISFVAIYLLGFNDVIAISALIASLWAVSNAKYRLAGASVAMAISAKASTLLALPVFAILFFRNPNARRGLWMYIASFGCSALLLQLPFFLFSPEGINAIASNREALRILESTIFLGTEIYLVPLGYLLVLLSLWKVRRVNLELFKMALGLVFMVVVLLTQASPGWYFWLLPLLMSVNFSKNRTNAVLTHGFSATYLFLFFPYELISSELHSSQMVKLIDTFGHTLLLSIGALLAVSIWRDSIKQNDYFLFSRKPFAIGVAGDSGVGKDTLANALTGIFGKSSTSQLSGDDYHRWERGEPVWHSTTHLNPAANEIVLFEQDSLKLLRGQKVHVRNYDHGTGKKTELKLVKPNDFIIISGLHTLYSPGLRDQLDLKIFMEMEEDLRKFLKLRRDVGTRGYSKEGVLDAIENRQADSSKFVVPQKKEADLIFRIESSKGVDFTDFEKESNFEWSLIVESHLGLDDFKLGQVLRRYAECDFEILEGDGGTMSSFRLKGDISADSVAIISNHMSLGVREFIDDQASWAGGVTGFMQLVVLLQLDHLLSKRAIV